MVPFCFFTHWKAQNPSISLDFAWRYLLDTCSGLFRLGVYSGDRQSRQNHKIGSWNACSWCDRPIPAGEELCWNCADEFGGIRCCSSSALRWFSSNRACIRRANGSRPGTVSSRLYRIGYTVRLFHRSGDAPIHSAICLRGDSQGRFLRRLGIASLRASYTSSSRYKFHFT